MNFFNKKTIFKLMAQAFVVTSILGIGIGCNLLLTKPIYASALDNNTEKVFLANSVSCQETATYYLKADGTVYQSGLNSDSALLPTKVNIDNVSKIISSTSSSFFIKNDGTIWTSGDNRFGQLGLGNTTSVSTPVQVPISNVKNIAVSKFSTFFLLNDGSVWACGYNCLGQLGLDNQIDQLSPIKVPISNVSFVSSSVCASTLFTKSDGTVWACGSNTCGQLGLNNSSATSNLTQINISNVKKAITVDGGCSIFIKNDTTTWGCGCNGAWRFLGLSSSILHQQLPIQLSSMLNGLDDATSNFNDLMFYIKSNKTIIASGLNCYEILGTNSGPNITPSGLVAVSNIPNTIKSISLGSGHCAIVKNDGTVWTIGLNVYGGLGIGSKGGRSIYTPVGKLLSSSFEVSSSVSSGTSSKTGVTITGTYKLPYGAFLANVTGTSGLSPNVTSIDDVITMTYDCSTGKPVYKSCTRAKDSLSERKIILNNVLKNGDYTITVEDNDGNSFTKTITINSLK